MVVPITNYLIARDIGRPVMGIPVFPDVSFAHLGVQVNVNAGIREPKDLEGKRVGVRGWGFNPGTWIRGALTDVYGLDLTKVHWVEAEPNSLMSVDYPRDPRFSVSKGGDQVAELESGELDAVLFDRAGPPLGANCARLFDDPLEAALAYHRHSGVFPVNVMLAAKQDVLDANPGLGQAVRGRVRRGAPPLLRQRLGRRPAHGPSGRLAARARPLPARERAGEQPPRRRDDRALRGRPRHHHPAFHAGRALLRGGSVGVGLAIYSEFSEFIKIL